MTQEKKLDYLIVSLIREEERYRSIVIPRDYHRKQELYRALVNVRPPLPCSEKFFKVQDEYLQEEIKVKGITRLADLTPIENGLYLWKGDITTLAIGGIVNAANSQLLGCFIPCHSCIDNAIHTFAGIQLRNDCADIMQEHGFAESTGTAKITKAYNLPSDYILHTVGPIVNDKLLPLHEQQLAACYGSCLELATKNEIQSLAFCCISTGEFHFPNQRAAEIAVTAVKNYQLFATHRIEVVFNVFQETDYAIYRKLLGANQ